MCVRHAASLHCWAHTDPCQVRLLPRQRRGRGRACSVISCMTVLSRSANACSTTLATSCAPAQLSTNEYEWLARPLMVFSYTQSTMTCDLRNEQTGWW